MTEPAVNIEHLFFKYTQPDHTCFADLNLSIPKAQRFGLFGPNGAGKTSLMMCMTGILSPQQGTVSIFGKDIQKNKKEIKKIIGFVPQELSFYQELSATENLQYFGALSGLNSTEIKKRTDELLEVLDLTNERHKAVQKLSGGMKRKVNLAIGVIHQPALLFLDEPTVGVDIQTRQAIITYLKQLNETGTTLVYTSHQLNEAQELCNSIALIDGGKIIAHNSPEKLFSEHQEKDLEGLFIKLTGKKLTPVNE